MNLASAAIPAGQRIPQQYTGDGHDDSPPLEWSDVPAEAQELALICDDPDAPSPQPWVHWLIYGIPPDVRGLPEDLPAIERITSPLMASQGHNSWTKGRVVGYRGPAPPPGHGPHHYHFTLYALDEKLGLPAGVAKPELLSAMSGHILAQAELVAIYER